MSKKTRGRRPAQAEASGAGDRINPKQACPCGDDSVIVLRPFEGLACEPDVIAVREFVPSAVATLALSEAGKALAGDKKPQLVSVLPGAAAAMVGAGAACSERIVARRKRMVYVPVQCPYCQSTEVIKAGKQANGVQRYRCQNDRCQRRVVFQIWR